MSCEDVSLLMERNAKSEVLLLLLRFLNIIMSRKRLKSEKSEVCLHLLQTWSKPTRYLFFHNYFISTQNRQVLAKINFLR